ncbi:hypothetical protein LEA_13523, partial [human gut metagenome]
SCNSYTGLTAVTGAKMAVIAAGCGAVSILFCHSTKVSFNFVY